MERIFEMALLYDFYGELLTDHQKRVYEDVVMSDMSLSEVAEELGISRQGVHDTVKRCDKILLEYEDKLHLVAKFDNMKNYVSKMGNCIECLEEDYKLKQDDDFQMNIERLKNLEKTILEDM